MMTMIDRLLSLRVSDLMATPVVSVSQDATLETAAELMFTHRLTCAPVVDPVGVCVGVVSATDFLGVFHGGCRNERLVEAPQGWHMEPCGSSVASIMTTAVQTIARDASLVTAARMLCGQHVHHLIVIDPEGRPQGMLSTLDLTAALLHSADELETERGRLGKGRSPRRFGEDRP